MTNGNGLSNYRADRYRRILTHGFPASTTLLAAMFRVPAHAQTSLAIKWISLWSGLGTVYTIAATDIINFFAFVSNNPINDLPVITPGGNPVQLASGQWAGPGTPGGNSLNPPNQAGITFPDPLLLTPNDDPAWFVFYDVNQSTGVTQAQWNATKLVVHGWEVASPEPATFPPVGFEATI